MKSGAVTLRLTVMCFTIGMITSRVAIAVVVVDHSPDQSGGLPSDTAYPDSGRVLSQRLADDFMISTAADIRRITWWGDYLLATPPSSETMRVRLYLEDSSTGLPGNLLFESPIANPIRQSTGMAVSGEPLASNTYSEYLFQLDFATPILLSPNTAYWLEIAQSGNSNSPFIWEFSGTDRNSFAVSNPSGAPWEIASLTEKDLAFQLSTIPEPSALALIILAMNLVRRKTCVP